MEPKIVAEKAVGLQVASVVVATIPRAFVVLVDRDPRDVFLSILAFNSRRGFDSFGAEDGKLVLAERLSQYYTSAATFYTEHSARVRVVPYREIVERPLDAVQRVSGRFKHERDAAALNLSEITSPNHVTSPSVPESVDRWLMAAGDWQEEFAILARASSVLRQAVGGRCDAPGHRPD
jgi:hypothetical protein